MSNNIQAIVDAIKGQEFNHAELLCWSELKNNPKSTDLYKLLGHSLLSQKNITALLTPIQNACQPEKEILI